MPDDEEYLLDQGENAEVVEYRYSRLLDLYPPDLALQLAQDRAVDLHEALDLAERCAPELAAHILT